MSLAPLMLLRWIATASLSNSAQVQVKHGDSHVSMDLKGITIRCSSCRNKGTYEPLVRAHG
jgi:hypothetical protein